MATFTFFNDDRCYSEIKDLIWEHAIAAVPPRIVELNGGIEETICTPDGDVVPVVFGFVSNAPIPVVLHICSRSRELAMKRWDLTFHSKYKLIDGNARHITPNLKAVPRTWFDFESDTLLFLEHTSNRSKNISLGQFFQDIKAENRKRVRNIAISIMRPLRDEDSDSDDSSDTYLGVSRELEASQLICEKLPEIRNISIAFRGITLMDILNRNDNPYDLSKGLRLLDGGDKWEEIVIEMFRAIFDEERGEGEVTINLVDLMK